MPHRQQLRNAMLVRSTVADVETAELDAATPEQVDAAVAAPAEATIAVNAETDQKSSSGGRQGRQGNGRRAPRVSLESISVDQEMEGVVVRSLQACRPPCVRAQHSSTEVCRSQVISTVGTLAYGCRPGVGLNDGCRLSCNLHVCCAEKRGRLRLLRRHRLRQRRPRPYLTAFGELPNACLPACVSVTQQQQ